MSVSAANVKKKNGGVLQPILIIGLVFILLIGAALGFLFLTPTGKALIGSEGIIEESTGAKYDLKSLAFTSLPEILLNLRASDGRPVILKVTFVIESSSAKIGEKIDKIKPMIIDQYQTHLRELDIDDLNSSAGLERMRQELISRTNSLLSPEKINNVLFKEFLIQ